jgi:hypothetical protein
MGVRVSREASFGPGSRGFRFEVRRDTVEDQKVYEIGQGFEADCSRKGSLGQRIFDRLSSTQKNSVSSDSE